MLARFGQPTLPNRECDYDNTVQMRFFVMPGTAELDERN